MARTVILRDPDDNKVYTWHDAIIDSVHSFTSVHSKRGNIFTLSDNRTKINLSGQAVSIYFNSGYYLQIFR